MARIEIGKYLVTDTRVCGGRLIFKGSRILVSDVLELVQAGYTPDSVAIQYRSLISSEAVQDALTLIRRGVVKEILPRRKTAA